MLSVIIPVLNEEEAVAMTVRDLRDALSPVPEWEIVVVDDGSTDATPRILAGLVDDRVRIVTHPQNLGNGASIKTGIRHARGDILATVDADGTYPLEDLPRLIAELSASGADMVVGARARNGEHIPFTHRIAKAILTSLAQYLTGLTIPDCNSGMRVFRRRLFERFLGLYPQGFSFHITITLGALTNDYLVQYVPIAYRKRIGRSKLSTGVRGHTNFLRFLHIVLRVVSYFRPLKFFLWPAGVLGALGVTGLILEGFRPWGAVSALAGLQLLLCGVIAEVLVRTRGSALLPSADRLSP